LADHGPQSGYCGRELDGPEVPLAIVDRLEDKLARYHAYHATRADLRRRLDCREESRTAYGKAIEWWAQTQNPFT
jgi:predicted RNA polymerase sigma factor